MRRFFAGAIFLAMILFCSFTIAQKGIIGGDYDQASVQVTQEYHDTTDEVTSEAEDEGSEDEESEVLGVNRQKGSTDKIIIGVEVSICLIFVVGLIAAGKGGYEN